MALPIAAIVAAGASLASTAGNTVTAGKNLKFQSRENALQRQWSKYMFDEQNKRDIEFWNMQNAYNDPLAQMQRLQNAGLNPHLVYGNGADTTASPIATHSAPNPNTKAPQLPPLGDILSGGLFSFLDVQQKKANVARTEAETESINANTANRQFLNGLNDTAYLQMLRSDMANKVNKGHFDTELRGLEYESLSEIYHNNHDLWLKAQKAGLERTIMDIDLAKTVGDKNKAETALKHFELQLNKQGIFRGDPLLYRILNGLMNSTFGGSLFNSIPSPKQFKNGVNNLFQ